MTAQEYIQEGGGYLIAGGFLLGFLSMFIAGLLFGFVGLLRRLVG